MFLKYSSKLKHVYLILNTTGNLHIHIELTRQTKLLLTNPFTSQFNSKVAKPENKPISPGNFQHFLLT